VGSADIRGIYPDFSDAIKREYPHCQYLQRVRMDFDTMSKPDSQPEKANTPQPDAVHKKVGK